MKSFKDTRYVKYYHQLFVYLCDLLRHIEHLGISSSTTFLMSLMNLQRLFIAGYASFKFGLAAKPPYCGPAYLVCYPRLSHCPSCGPYSLLLLCFCSYWFSCLKHLSLILSV